MKKITTLSMAVASLALLTGCGALGAAPAPTVTVTQSASPAASPNAEAAADAEPPNKTMWDYQEGVRPDAVFYEVVRKGTTTLGSYTDDDLAVMAQTTCAALANGEATGKDIVLKQAAMAAARQDGELTGQMGTDVGYLIGVGAQNYCPDQLATLQSLFDS